MLQLRARVLLTGFPRSPFDGQEGLAVRFDEEMNCWDCLMSSGTLQVVHSANLRVISPPGVYPRAAVEAKKVFPEGDEFVLL